MLVLSRKIEDEIIIDENITIRVLRVKGNTVRLGISAPSDVSIMRGELPRREIEFELSTEDVEEEPEPEIRFQRFAPQPPRQNRLQELVKQVNRSIR
jgi:carbon storage regulator CsrA